MIGESTKKDTGLIRKMMKSRDWSLGSEIATLAMACASYLDGRNENTKESFVSFIDACLGRLADERSRQIESHAMECREVLLAEIEDCKSARVNLARLTGIVANDSGSNNVKQVGV